VFEKLGEEYQGGGAEKRIRTQRGSPGLSDDAQRQEGKRSSLGNAEGQDGGKYTAVKLVGIAGGKEKDSERGSAKGKRAVGKAKRAHLKGKTRAPNKPPRLQEKSPITPEKTKDRRHVRVLSRARRKGPTARTKS